MIRLVFGVIFGFFGWMGLWFGGEIALSVISPDWFGVQHNAFQAAIESGGQYNPHTSFLLAQVFCAASVSLISGFLAALVSGENKSAPLVLGLILLAIGFAKAAMSWELVPIWYHASFSIILISMTIVGGKLKRTA